MKFLVCAAVMIAGAMAAPGGMVGYGGVYKNMQIDGDSMNAAKNAAKVAVDIFNDESLTDFVEDRKVRKAVYIPTFFTSVQQAEPHPAAIQAQRFSRDTQVLKLTIEKSYLTSHILISDPSGTEL